MTMVKTIYLIKKKPGLTPAEFREHYEEVYVPLALSLYPTIRKSVRNYTIPNDIPTNAVDLDFDCMTEVWFDDMEGFQAMVDTANGDAGQADVHCQKVFIDLTQTAYSLVEEVESEIA